MGERSKRTLIVTNHRVVTTFNNQRGEDTTIYEIFATNPQGVPLDAKQFPLRSFWEPSAEEIGKPVEYEVEPYRHEKYGLTYTLHRPKGSGGGSGLKGSVDALRAEVKELTGRVEALEARQGGAPAPVPTPGSAPPLPPTDESPAVQGATAMNPPTPPSRGTAPRTSDDDIPF